MTSRLRQVFSDADLEAIRAATAEAEAKTSGEIVPYLVERLDEHPEARARGAVLGALIAALAAGALHAFGEVWGGSGMTWITLPTLLGMIVGGWLGGFGPVGRRLVDDDTLERRAVLRAESAFLEEEVFRTRDRTGILILLGLWEHRAVILADEGIHRSVPEGAWQELVDALVAGIAAGRSTEALVEVIGRCGDLLERHDVRRRPDDEDELSDRPRLRES
ncbi:MAG: hypothetical protein AAGE94_22785 [Acidobacteriota bacterium]